MAPFHRTPIPIFCLTEEAIHVGRNSVFGAGSMKLSALNEYRPHAQYQAALLTHSINQLLPPRFYMLSLPFPFSPLINFLLSSPSLRRAEAPRCVRSGGLACTVD